MVASQSSTARDVGSTSASGSATTWAAAYAIRLLGGPGGSSRTACLPGAYGSSDPSAYGSRICSVILTLLLWVPIDRLLPPPARRRATGCFSSSGLYETPGRGSALLSALQAPHQPLCGTVTDGPQRERGIDARAGGKNGAAEDVEPGGVMHAELRIDHRGGRVFSHPAPAKVVAAANAGETRTVPCLGRAHLA